MTNDLTTISQADENLNLLIKTLYNVPLYVLEHYLSKNTRVVSIYWGEDSNIYIARKHIKDIYEDRTNK
jgi:hypothetical protein